ncbi:hypothetical protein NQ315_009522 [Exocentrus adspersus]|uniref:Large ribosomal subunit protein bL9m n=1 Tax=Exocentrus adspersus TaxID=1586481 RepID=A0AAV8WIW4_9CUCU|nr:hypothetical protein NQ315_009522 [Exocentrus adspersus]
MNKMFKYLSFALNTATNARIALLTPETIFHNQLRTTFVVKRRLPLRLNKQGRPPKNISGRHYIYDVVEQKHSQKDPEIDLILTTYVDGLGNVGDKISVTRTKAYNNLLLPGLAVYASPENLEKYKDYVYEGEPHSSPTAALTVKSLGRTSVSVVMNMETPWTLKPWHVKASFRKCGYIVPEEAITLPDKPITGPDMNKQNKEFFVTVTINNLETVNVRCRIHHWSNELVNRVPYTPYFWEQPSEAILPEQAPILETLPIKPKKRKQQ